MQLEAKKSVLVLEDDPQWQIIVSQLLKKVDQNFEVRCVPTSAAAMRLLDNGQSYDLIIADQFLEGSTTGLEFYRQLRNRRDQTSFVMLSGLGSAEFQDLSGHDSELPTFISKASAFKNFGEIVRTEIRAGAYAVELREDVVSSPKGERAFLMILTVSAMAFTVSQLVLSEKEDPRVQASPVSFTSAPVDGEMKAPLKIGRLKIAPRQPTLLLPAPAKPTAKGLDTAALKSQIQRIVKRADTITKQVAAE